MAIVIMIAAIGAYLLFLLCDWIEERNKDSKRESGKNRDKLSFPTRH